MGAAGLIPGPCRRRVPVGLLLAPPAAGHRPEHPLTWLLPAGPHSQPQGHGHGFAGRRRAGRARVLHKRHVGCPVPVLEPAPDGGTLLSQAQRQRWAPCPWGGAGRALGALRENTAPRGSGCQAQRPAARRLLRNLQTSRPYATELSSVPCVCFLLLLPSLGSPRLSGAAGLAGWEGQARSHPALR